MEKVAVEIGDIADLLDFVSHLEEINAAPRWLWPARVTVMLDKQWRKTPYFTTAR